MNKYKFGVNACGVEPVACNEFVRTIQNLRVFWAVLSEQPPGSAYVARNG